MLMVGIRYLQILVWDKADYHLYLTMTVLVTASLHHRTTNCERQNKAVPNN
jgi:hypothetical protein